MRFLDPKSFHTFVQLTHNKHPSGVDTFEGHPSEIQDKHLIMQIKSFSIIKYVTFQIFTILECSSRFITLVVCLTATSSKGQEEQIKT